MLRRTEYQGVDWLDLESPTEEELREVSERFALHPVAASELTSPSPRSKLDVYNDFLYLVLHFPICQSCRSGEEKKIGEVDFIIGRHFLITTHYEPSDSLDESLKLFESQLGFTPEKSELRTGVLFSYLLRELYRRLFLDLETINNQLRQVEENVFRGREREMVESLSRLNRDLLDFDWNLRPHLEILRDGGAAGEEFFGQKFERYFAAARREYDKALRLMDANNRAFLALRETNESLLSIKNNEVMRRLSALAFIFLPMTLLVQIFSMNVRIPLERFGNSALYLIIALMIAVTMATYFFARRARWF